MKIIDLQQRSPQWSAWRKGKIGSSDIATIARMDPYKDPQALYDEWITDTSEIVDNEHIRRGVELEPRALEQLNDGLGSHQGRFVPLCIESDKNSRFIASLDGYNEKLGMGAEIKCPSESNFEKCKFKIPEQYIAQMQWQMFVGDMQLMTFFCYSEIYGVSESFSRTIDRDERLIEKLQIAAHDFLMRVDSFEPLEDKYKTIPDDYKDLIKKYVNLKEEISIKETECAFIKDSLLKMMGEGNFQGHGVTITVNRGRTSYDYKSMAKDGIDLTSYTKVGKESRSIKINQ